MPREVDGGSSILAATRKICRLVGRFGTGGVDRIAGEEMAAAVAVLVALCIAFDLTDDYPGQVDRTTGTEPADGVPV